MLRVIVRSPKKKLKFRERATYMQMFNMMIIREEIEFSVYALYSPSEELPKWVLENKESCYKYVTLRFRSNGLYRR